MKCFDVDVDSHRSIPAGPPEIDEFAFLSIPRLPSTSSDFLLLDSFSRRPPLFLRSPLEGHALAANARPLLGSVGSQSKKESTFAYQ